MRQILIAVLVLAFPLPARAGIYIPGQEPELVGKDGKPRELPFDQFRLRLADLKGIPVAVPESEARKKYLKRLAELESRRPERLSADELLQLGECQVRLGQLEKAFFAYHLATTKDPRNFLAQSGLAAVYQMSNDLLQARQRQIDALSLQPKLLPGMTKEQTAWLLRVEKVFGQLQRGRLREFRDKTPLAQLSVDDLFGVQFVGAGGSYEAGAIAPDQKAKLPPDALAVVQQLVLWYPFDARLYWLLGELYNANGQMREALLVFDECLFSRNFQADRLKEHKRLIDDSLAQLAATEKKSQAAAAAQKQADEEQKDFSKHPEILWAVGGVGGVLVLLLVIWQVGIIWRRAMSGKKKHQKN